MYRDETSIGVDRMGVIATLLGLLAVHHQRIYRDVETFSLLHPEGWIETQQSPSSPLHPMPSIHPPPLNNSAVPPVQSTFSSLISIVNEKTFCLSLSPPSFLEKSTGHLWL